MEPIRRQRILKQHLQTDRLLGVPYVPVNQVAECSALSPPIARSTSLSSQVPEPQTAGGSPVPAMAAMPRKPKASSSAVPSSTSSLLACLSPAEVVENPRPGHPSSLSRQQKLDILQAIDRDEVKNCRKCRLCQGRTQTVFGEGDPDTPILFIGEGPGENEDLQGRPFVGRAGELLEKMILAIGYQRQQVFIANIVKCRPPGNRAPMPEEIDACWSYLHRQIATIRPKVIVTLGGPATKTLLQTDQGITKIRGIWHLFGGAKDPEMAIPAMPTFHPAYLLRAYTIENRQKVWSDLKQAAALAQSDPANG